MDYVKEQLKKQFEMKDSGELEYFLGIRDRVNRRIHSDTSIQFLNCSTVTQSPILLPQGQYCTNDDDAERLIDQQHSQSIVGSLMHAMLGTRPDIGYAVSIVAIQFEPERNASQYCQACPQILTERQISGSPMAAVNC